MRQTWRPCALQTRAAGKESTPPHYSCGGEQTQPQSGNPAPVRQPQCKKSGADNATQGGLFQSFRFNTPPAATSGLLSVLGCLELAKYMRRQLPAYCAVATISTAEAPATCKKGPCSAGGKTKRGSAADETDGAAGSKAPIDCTLQIVQEKARKLMGTFLIQRVAS